MTQTMRPEIVVAVRWWAATLSDPGWRDNGDLLQSLFLTAVMDKGELPQAFMKTLAQEIERDLPSWFWASLDFYEIHIDYHVYPQHVLWRAWAASGGDPETLKRRVPVKTHMQIVPGKVVAAKGYGAPFQVLYDSAAMTNERVER